MLYLKTGEYKTTQFPPFYPFSDETGKPINETLNEAVMFLFKCRL